MSEPLSIAKAGEFLCLLPDMANRHGLIAGATGTGKTITLQVMAEGFSRIGVPVFAADIKGDRFTQSVGFARCSSWPLSPNLET